MEGLDQQEVGEFVEASTGVALPLPTVETIQRRTEGNPLFVGEVVSLFTTEEIREDYDWANTIPGGVHARCYNHPATEPTCPYKTEGYGAPCPRVALCG